MSNNKIEKMITRKKSTKNQYLMMRLKKKIREKKKRVRLGLKKKNLGIWVYTTYNKSSTTINDTSPIAPNSFLENRGVGFLPKKLFFNPFSPEKHLLKETNL
jgi:hypothetical protein